MIEIVQLARDTERGLHVACTQCTLHTTTSTIPLALSIKPRACLEADVLIRFVPPCDEDEKYKTIIDTM
jgi:hypothetical protein